MSLIVLTGAAGTLGTVLRHGLAARGHRLRLTDIAPVSDLKPDEEFIEADLRDGVAVARLMQGASAVVHFGAIPVEDTFGAIIESNIRASYNVFEAARIAGARRVVFASSNHAIGFHRRSSRIDHTAALRPDTFYGLSKAFGENLGRLYVDKHGFKVLALRIGSCLPRPENARHLATWISHRDLVQLVETGLTSKGLRFLAAYGASANTRSWWDNSAIEALGYAPQDNSEDWAEEILARQVPEDADDVALRFQGGVFTSDRFDGDVDAIED